MSIFDGKRLDKKIFRVDVERIREGWYSDAYFSNIVEILEILSGEGYTFKGNSSIEGAKGIPVQTGDIEVEMQFFTRRRPFSLVAGVDEALAILEECTGYFDEEGNFVNTYTNLEVEAVQDGSFAYYAGDPAQVQPVLKIRGRYRDYATLETIVLGVLSETTRVATNVYNVLVASRGKDVLFFPARFSHYKLQALHGYAYSLAVQAYNYKFNKNTRAFVSTNDQGGWCGAKGGGTIAHSSIACFLGDTAETMMQFSRVMPLEIPRIALVDFHNDCAGETLKVMNKMFSHYWKLYKSGQAEEAKKYRLFAVRLDTAGNMRDEAVPPLGDKKLDCGVNPRLVWAVRNTIDTAYERWELPYNAVEAAREWCGQVKIVVTGGFNAAKINQFEELGVPADIYGVGSALLENSGENNTKNDYTADIVRVKMGEKWHPMAKVGRQPCENPSLEKIQ
ncbi:MAG: nicotinate phosphoribosyltransferase [Firmicutes bacterium HGW-Firmicutes-14]|nr:MAG: nicotinate phosphoribosyltransferase [Firmicutes bacterium HGW-Firmicutes-14]